MELIISIESFVLSFLDFKTVLNASRFTPDTSCKVVSTSSFALGGVFPRRTMIPLKMGIYPEKDFINPSARNFLFPKEERYPCLISINLTLSSRSQ